MASTAILADYRLLHALRSGQPGGFASLWNAHVGRAWSVLRALCASDAEAMGWVTTFRVDLAQRVMTFDAEEPLAMQVGLALYQHLRGGFPRAEPLPEVPFPATEDALRTIPEGLRLLYLVELFFDVPEDALCRAAGADVRPQLREVARRMEPDGDTAARLTTHTALLREPPAAAYFLPPHAEPPPPRPRWPWWVAGASLLLMLAATPAVWAILFRATWERAADWHDATVAGTSVELASSPEDLVQRLIGDGVPSALAHVPDLDELGLTLRAARLLHLPDVGVVLVYQEGARFWTLQHLRRGLPAGEAPVVATRATDAGPLEAHGVGDTVLVAWTEGDAVWILGADAPPDAVLDRAEAIRERRLRAADPATWSLSPVSPGKRSQ